MCYLSLCLCKLKRFPKHKCTWILFQFEKHIVCILTFLFIVVSWILSPYFIQQLATRPNRRKQSFHENFFMFQHSMHNTNSLKCYSFLFKMLFIFCNKIFKHHHREATYIILAKQNELWVVNNLWAHFIYYIVTLKSHHIHRWKPSTFRTNAWLWKPISNIGETFFLMSL